MGFTKFETKSPPSGRIFRKAGRLFSEAGSGYGYYLVVLGLDGGLKNAVGDVAREGDYGGAGGVADVGGFYARDGLKRLFDGGFAMAAHHAFDSECFCHGVFLL